MVWLAKVLLLLLPGEHLTCRSASLATLLITVLADFFPEAGLFVVAFGFGPAPLQSVMLG